MPTTEHIKPGFSLGEACPQKWRPAGALLLAQKTCCLDFA